MLSPNSRALAHTGGSDSESNGSVTTSLEHVGCWSVDPYSIEESAERRLSEQPAASRHELPSSSNRSGISGGPSTSDQPEHKRCPMKLASLIAARPRVFRR